MGNLKGSFISGLGCYRIDMSEIKIMLWLQIFGLKASLHGMTFGGW